MSISFWSSLFHLSTTRAEKKYLQRSKVSKQFLCFTFFHEWPRVLCWLSASKNSSNLRADDPFFILNTSSRSARFRRSFSDQMPSDFNRCSYSKFFRPGIISIQNLLICIARNRSHWRASKDISLPYSYLHLCVYLLLLSHPNRMVL